MVRTKADLPFTLSIFGYRVRFGLDADGEHVLATCYELPELSVRSPVTDHAVADAAAMVVRLIADEVEGRR